MSRLRSLPFRRALLDATLVALVGGIAVAVLAAGTSSSRKLSPATAPPAQGGPRENEREERKNRDEWFYGQRMFPRDTIPGGAYVEARAEARAAHVASRKVLRTAATRAARSPAEANALAAAANIDFTELGPRPIGSRTPWMSGYLYFGVPPNSGRVSAIATHPTLGDTVYIGGANGGVWKTTDGGTNWSALFDGQESLSIGAIAVDPNDGQTVYVGTGENNFGMAYFGAGIFKSENGGAAWSKIGELGRFDQCHVWDIVVKPDDSDTILVAVQGWGSTFSAGVRITPCDVKSGVWRSTNGGDTWAHVFSGVRVTDLEVDRTDPDTWYAGVYADGVYRSPSTGDLNSWTKLGGGLPNANLGRVRLGIAPTNGQTLYAAFSALSNRDLLGIWSTTNGGTAWTQRPQDPEFCGYYDQFGVIGSQQCDYDLSLVVSPTDPTRFAAAGIRFYDYTNTGANYIRRGFGAAGVHVDFHALAYDASGRLWIGADGGAYRTSDGGVTFFNANNGLGLTQYYPGISGSAAGPIIGGSQDNGTSKWAGTLSWRSIGPADGGYTAMDPAAPLTMYQTSQFLDVMKSTDGGESFADAVNGIGNEARAFIAPLVMDPVTPSTLYAGTDRIYRTTNSAGLWGALSPSFGADVSAIARAPSSANTIYAGTEDGQIRVTTDGGASWPDNSPAPVPARWITDIAVHDTNASEAYVAVSGFDTGHLFRTTTAGVEWDDISGSGATGLPNAPANAVAIDTRTTPTTIYVGTDVGVFWSTDGGTTWLETSVGLPNTVVMDLLLDKTANKLIAATHGRGMWVAPLPDAPQIGKIAYKSTRNGGDYDIFVVNDDGSGSVTDLTDNATFHDEDPASSPDGTEIAFASDRDGDYDVYVMNADGTNVRQITNTAGIDEFPTWSPDGQWLAFDSDRSGNYEIYVVPVAGGEATRLTDQAGDDQIPAWSPGGDRIAFQSNRTGNLEIFVVAPTGGTATNLTNAAGNDEEPAWSPDGTKLAWDSNRPGNYELYKADPDGSNVERLTTNTVVDEFASWSPTGETLVFDQRVGATADYNLYKVAAAGGTPTQLSSNVAPDRDPTWLLAGVTDDVAPETTILTGPTGTVEATTASFTFGANELGATFECKLDAGAFAACTSPKGYTGLAPGGHTFHVRAEDTADNVDATPATRSWTVSAPPPTESVRGDYNGDGRTDYSVFRPSTNEFRIAGQKIVAYGQAGDIPVPADYNGDRKTDVAVFRPATAEWRVGGQFIVAYGQNGDLPVPGDYNGDGTADVAVYRPSTSQWRLRGMLITTYGGANEVPVPADYNGDGRDDIAMFNTATGQWRVQGQLVLTYGQAGDIPVPADYNGDGKDDLAVFRPSTGQWRIAGQLIFTYGQSGDMPVQGDYTGAGRARLAVYRPGATGQFRVAGVALFSYGVAGDVPLVMPPAVRMTFFP